MSKGPLITGIVAVAAMFGTVAAFMASANPYVDSIAEARRTADDRIHLAADIVRGTVRQDLRQGQMTFQVKDSHGETILVRHRGDPPANMGEATQVVAIGGVKNGEFVSEKLLIKCPSKYEGQAATESVAARS